MDKCHELFPKLLLMSTKFPSSVNVYMLNLCQIFRGLYNLPLYTLSLSILYSSFFPLMRLKVYCLKNNNLKLKFSKHLIFFCRRKNNQRSDDLVFVPEPKDSSEPLIASKNVL